MTYLLYWVGQTVNSELIFPQDGMKKPERFRPAL